MICKYYRKIRDVYSNDILFFILIFFLFSITDVYYNAKNNQYFKCFYTLIDAYVLSGFTCLILTYTNKSLRKVLNFVIVLFLFLYIVVNYFSITLTLRPLNNGIITLLLSTNFNEIIEFIQSYVSIYNVILIIIAFFLLVKISYRKLQLNNLFLLKILSVAFIFNLFLLVIHPYSIHETPIGRIYVIYRDKHVIELMPNLSLYKNNPEFISSRNEHPENIIVIIGESFAKTHSSIYGYHKNTNPLLEKHIKNGDLYIFNKVVAPASHTMDVFKAIMSTFSYNRKDSAWYKHTTIPVCFNKLGYRTVWISNQNQYGTFDNIPTRYSQLCDTAIFTKKKINDNFKDEQILNYINETLNEKDFFIFHLMGQHNKYSERYPESFNYFTYNDYPNLPEHQRETIAEYDNATLYNDFVVDSIIKAFSDKESIIFYISDHGQDLFYSDNKYFGHGITANAKSDSIGRDIPFMVYISPKLKNRIPDLYKKIQSSIDRKYNTENLIYTLIDISGYKFSNNEDVERNSLFNIN